MKRRGFLQFLGLAPAAAVAAASVKAPVTEAAAIQAPATGLDGIREDMQELLDRNYCDYLTACTHSISATSLRSVGRWETK
jgi:hypothetical protein